MGWLIVYVAIYVERHQCRWTSKFVLVIIIVLNCKLQFMFFIQTVSGTKPLFVLHYKVQKQARHVVNFCFMLAWLADLVL